MTVTLPADLQEQLEALGRETGRDPQAIAVDALTDYVEDQAAYVAAVRRGIADMEVGNVVSHEEVMRQLSAVVQHARGRLG
ncbi:MAG TPA: hypothetical protein VFU02_24895 [Polyangiaceae bacterium]|nr:hypothetical protein [Polyangiaceae bacterium]